MIMKKGLVEMAWSEAGKQDDEQKTTKELVEGGLKLAK